MVCIMNRGMPYYYNNDIYILCIKVNYVNKIFEKSCNKVHSTKPGI